MITETNSKHLTETYVEKPDYYFQITRTDLLRLLPGQTQFNHVLGVGAGGGNTLLYLKNAGIAKRVTGIELFEFPGTEQQNPAIDKFIIGNIEHFRADSFAEEFDLIICGDVLEHLINPWAVRDKIIHWLKPGGLLLASIPNIRELKTVLKILLRGTFTYEDGGVMDRTHLRFFCKKNITNLLHTDKLKIEKITTNLAYPERDTKTRATLNSISFKLFEEFLARQYFVLTRKAGSLPLTAHH
jgi:2-polyprenyl-3-methyl-5-hydroxy-6-metoxy-1,4-benzoquinol methylase